MKIILEGTLEENLSGELVVESEPPKVSRTYIIDSVFKQFLCKQVRITIEEIP